MDANTKLPKEVNLGLSISPRAVSRDKGLPYRTAEQMIDLKTCKALGAIVPPTLHTADEVIE